MYNIIILASWNNSFFLGGEDWFISFDKNNQEIFLHLKSMMENSSKKSIIFISTGPGSFIGTRSVFSFVLGYTFKKNIEVYGFNLLLDLLPKLTSEIKTNKKKTYIYEELKRFYYCFNEEKKEFLLLSKSEVDRLCEDKTRLTLGNYEKCEEIKTLDYFIIRNTMIELFNLEKNTYFFNKIQYSDKFK